MKGSTLLSLVTLVICAGLLYFEYQNTKEFERLHEENLILWEKLDSLQSGVASRPSSASPRNVAPAQTGAASFLDELFSDLQKDYQDSKKASQKKAAAAKIVVETSYRIEDRYVSYGLHEPDLQPNEPGTVVIDIEVDYSGDVKKTHVNSASNISDEPILDACRKAALQTKFNYDSDKGYKTMQKGTITYTFKKK